MVVARKSFTLIMLATARHCSHKDAKKAIFSAFTYPFLDVKAGLSRLVGGVAPVNKGGGGAAAR